MTIHPIDDETPPMPNKLCLAAPASVAAHSSNQTKLKKKRPESVWVSVAVSEYWPQWAALLGQEYPVSVRRLAIRKNQGLCEIIRASRLRISEHAPVARGSWIGGPQHIGSLGTESIACQYNSSVACN